VHLQWLLSFADDEYQERAGQGNRPSHWDHGKNQSWQVTAFLSTRLRRLFKKFLVSFFSFVANVFPIAPYFNPICFGKCYPPLSYIAEPKGRNTMVENRNLSSGEPS
jgi:hypothetical protein